MSLRRLDDLLILVHDVRLAPSDAEWERYIKWCTELLKSHRELKVLVIAGDVPPSSKQRSLYNKEIGQENVRLAIVVRSPAVLAVVKVFSWFVKHIKPFSENDIESALAYLGVTPSREIREAIEQLRSSFTKTGT